MGARQKILKSQLDTAEIVLSSLKAAVPTDYIGLVATTGQPIAVISSTRQDDNDSMAALAASAFAASRQLAGLAHGNEPRSLLCEAGGVNVSIACIAGNLLLVVFFPRSSDIGRVRLLVRLAAARLEPIFDIEGADSGAD